MALQNFPRRFGRLCFLCSSDSFSGLPVHASAVVRVAPIRTAGRPFSDDQSHVRHLHATKPPRAPGFGNLTLVLVGMPIEI